MLNVRGAFGANQHIVDGRTVLVVDDVTTSGATLHACALALKGAGALEIYCLTLARSFWDVGPNSDSGFEIGKSLQSVESGF